MRVNKKYKEIYKGKKARDGLYRGIKKVADVVSSTLGHGGRNVIVEKPGRVPYITNDGVTIARNIAIENRLENVGARVLIDTAVKTNKAVGDGTTTSIVLAKAIIDSVLRETDDDTLGGGFSSNVIAIKNKIDKTKNKVVEMLKKKAKPCDDFETLKKVATISTQDKKIGEIIAKMVEKVGADGFIDIEDNVRPQIEEETVQGMKFYGGYVHHYLSTNRAKLTATYENVPIIVTNGEVESRENLEKIIKIVKSQLKKEKVVIIARDFSKEVVSPIVNTKMAGKFYILAIKGKALRDKELEDICIYTGATFFDITNKDANLSMISKDHFGFAEKIITDANETILIEGGGEKALIEKRIEELKIQREEVEETPTFQKKLEKRIASLSAGVGSIKVGAVTEAERVYLKHKIEDAVNATQTALEEGVVKGGGLALKEISDKLSKDNLLKTPLEAPYEKIKENANVEKLKVGDDVVDSVKVTRTAFENACSIAGTFITAHAVLCDKGESVEDSIRNIINETND